MTDVTDIEGMFRIIESIPSKNAESIKQWLAKLGSELSLIHIQMCIRDRGINTDINGRMLLVHKYDNEKNEMYDYDRLEEELNKYI